LVIVGLLGVVANLARGWDPATRDFASGQLIGFAGCLAETSRAANRTPVVTTATASTQ